jgi:replicative DNA helicase
MSDNILPPHDIAAEQAVLGGLLIDPDAIFDVPFLTPADFYSVKNKDLYRAMLGLQEKQIPIDFRTVCSAVTADQETEAYVIGLLNEVPTSINTRHYGRIVAASAQRRRLIRAAGTIATAGYDMTSSLEAVMATAQGALLDITDGVGGGDLVSAHDGVSALLDVTLARHAAGGQAVGIMTGLADVDGIIDGLQPGNLYVLAGRPGMGKSALEGTIAHHVSAAGLTVARFNLEMPQIQIWQRLVCLTTGLDFKKLQRGQFSEQELTTFTRAAGELSQRNIYIDDTPANTVTAMLSRCRRLQMRGPLDLVTVDYLQLMQAERNLGNRVQEVGEVSRGLKQMAKTLNVPVLALAQLSRGVEQRHDKRPILSDLRDSGEIEQDADVVMFLYRDEAYYPDTTDVPNQAELNIAKHRNGATGTARLYWNAPRMSFKNLARETIQL